MDISSDLLEEARERGLPEDRCSSSKKRSKSASGRPFDAVIGHRFCITSILRVTSRIFSLLRPGGWMSFAEPNMLNPQIFFQKNIPWLKERLGDSPDETAFVRHSLKRRLESSGFDRVAITPFDWLHPLTPARFIHVVSKIGAFLEAAPLVREFAGSLYIRCRRPA